MRTLTIPPYDKKTSSSTPDIAPSIASDSQGKFQDTAQDVAQNAAQDVAQDAAQHYHYDKAYVETNLIAYIGNKRRLLPLIVKALEATRLIGECGGTKVERSGVFIDYFSGTGVVARLAKSLGFGVIANDWEPYAYILGRGFLETSKETLALFSDEGGLESVLTRLNQHSRYDKNRSYFSKYYCPRATDQADPHSERLFYTRENGILIDNIRGAIDLAYPATVKNVICQQKRQLLLALLLVQASKRSNTSGIFKAYHHGFGGRNQDALGRILAPIALEMPTLSEHSTRARVFKSDAVRLARKLKRTNLVAEIVYLDPPYNQHQYGSNYHLLNTIALGDKPKVAKNFWYNGKKVHKSAIRRDWTQTRSSFCYRKSALHDFTSLIKAIKAKYILVSYSTEGIINFNSMLEVLSQKGKISVVTHNYVRFRGGRQTNVTKKRNVEFILIVETGAQSTQADIVRVQMKVGQADFVNCFNDFFPIHRPSRHYKVIEREFGYELFFTPKRERLFLDKRLRLYHQCPKPFSPESSSLSSTLLPNSSSAAASSGKSSLVGALLANSSLAGTSLADSSSAGASLANSSLAGTSLADSSSAGASLRESSSAGTSLANSSLAGTSLADSSSAGASLVNLSVWNTSLSGQALPQYVDPSIIEAILEVMPETNEERIHGIAELIEKDYAIDTPYFLGELVRLYKKLMGDTKHMAALRRSRTHIQSALRHVTKRATNQAINHQATSRQVENHQAENHQATSRQSENHQAENHQATSHQSENDQATSHQVESDQATSHQSANHQVENHQVTNHQATNITDTTKKTPHQTLKRSRIRKRSPNQPHSHKARFHELNSNKTSLERAGTEKLEQMAPSLHKKIRELALIMGIVS